MKKVAIFGIVIFAKFLAFISRSLKKGSGTALPGYLVEYYAKWVVATLAKDLKEIIFISGTNGKTTTRALLNHIYEKNGVEVCSNLGGANIFRGIASALILNTKWNLKPKKTTAILEVEEATMTILADYLKPQILILTNVFRDQLDVYGEIDQTVKYFKTTLEKTKPIVVVNADDYKLLQCLQNFEGTILGFQVDNQDKPIFESNSPVDLNFQQIFVARNIQLTDSGQSFEVVLGSQKETIKSNLSGIYNTYNILAALVCSYQKFGTQAIAPISSFQPVFGRGEKIFFGNTEIILFLIKNPAGFDQVLNQLHQQFQHEEINIIISINDNIADGKDVSWLWDVNLEQFASQQKVSVLKTAGTRGLDMLLRLEYAGFEVKPEDYLGQKGQDIITFCKAFSGKIIVLCTYTALLEFRSSLAHLVDIKSINNTGN